MKKLLLLLAFVLTSHILSATTYCTPAYYSAGSTGTGGAIGQMMEFTFNGYAGYTLDDTMMRPLFSTTEYLDETTVLNDTLQMIQGGTYAGTVFYGTSSPYMGNQIWVDFNDNGVFENSEQVTSVFPNYWVPTGSGIMSSAYTMNIPSTAATGYHRCRVRNVWYCVYASVCSSHSCGCVSSNLDPCIDYDASNSYYTGNTVDYTAYVHEYCALAVTATNSGYACDGGTVSFTGTVSGGTATGYSWTGPGGFTSTLLNPTITGGTASESGTYVLTVSSSASCSSSAGTSVTIYPALSATVTGTSTLCSGGTGSVTISGTPNATVYYKINGGSTMNATIGAGGSVTMSTGVLTTGSSSTTYTYSLVSESIAGGRCSVSLSGTWVITVYPQPTVISGSTSICTGISSTFTNGVPSGTWSSSDTAVANINASTGGTRTGTSVGTATISYTAGGGCYATLAIAVASSPSPISGTTSECPGSTVVLTDPSGAGNWVSSNSLIASVDPTGGAVTGMSAGTATITFSQSSGCFALVSFTVNPVPSVITGTRRTCEAGGTTTLFDTLSGGSWSSSNSLLATVNPSTGVVTGVSSGAVTITYTRLGCYNTTTYSILALPPSIISPLGDTMLCTGDEVALTANTATGFTYQWKNGSGAITGETDNYYIATTPDNYSVTITNANGCINTSTLMAVTLNPISAWAATSSPTIFCQGENALLSANLGTGFTYQWQNDGAGIPGATNSTYSATVNGDYTVVVSNVAGCSATSDTAITIDVHPAPINILTVSGPTNICTGASITMTADTASGLSYQWLVGGVAISGATSVSYTTTTPGNYQVRETNGYPCTSTSATAAVTNIALPSAAITATGSLAFCTGSSVTMNGPAGAVSYQWYDNGVMIPGAIASSYTTYATGNFAVQVVASTGCQNTTSPTVLAQEVSVPVITPFSPTTFCWGSTALLGVSVSSTAGVTYQWQLNGANIPGGTNSLYVAGASGDYSCIINIAGSCTSAATATTLTELPLPDPIISYDGNTMSTGNYYRNYKWYLDYAPLTIFSSSFVPDATGSYTVKVTDSNGCQSVSSAMVLTTLGSTRSLGVNSAVISPVSIFPNPAQNTIHISAQYPVKAIITAMDGRKVLEQTDATDMNITSLSSGVYMITLYDKANNKVKEEKLVKN